MASCSRRAGPASPTILDVVAHLKSGQGLRLMIASAILSFLITYTFHCVHLSYSDITVKHPQHHVSSADVAPQAPATYSVPTHSTQQLGWHLQQQRIGDFPSTVTPDTLVLNNNADKSAGSIRNSASASSVSASSVSASTASTITFTASATSASASTVSAFTASTVTSIVNTDGDVGHRAGHAVSAVAQTAASAVAQ
eukprot:CAMPEP_0181248906 /NCGR_PEP_ID=MMETSP1096-20121128/45438_1 /TAXON_ID=156174 ORGANISM="Chrysochromulina ericina, Strain CCMP281" /NCGR_SAMPLE_ID=MMETSP1096 /ASSEMBLY_ACC=CAM_ASM_000453 /LENGTH=196 /DNA_ID=CAMNT_0023346143 /DNA_START=90 /DNA_END=677 /DNA_ORIENTATION=-